MGKRRQRRRHRRLAKQVLKYGPSAKRTHKAIGKPHRGGRSGKNY